MSQRYMSGWFLNHNLFQKICDKKLEVDPTHDKVVTFNLSIYSHTQLNLSTSLTKVQHIHM